jgi:hypothetical protein
MKLLGKCIQSALPYMPLPKINPPPPDGRGFLKTSELLLTNLERTLTITEIYRFLGLD